MHLSKQAPPSAFHNCSYLNSAPPETCNYLSRGALIGSDTVYLAHISPKLNFGVIQTLK